VEPTNSSWLHVKEARHSVATSAAGETTTGRGNEGDDANWTDTIGITKTYVAQSRWEKHFLSVFVFFRLVV
jgi:hypothetical protein